MIRLSSRHTFPVFAVSFLFFSSHCVSSFCVASTLTHERFRCYFLSFLSIIVIAFEERKRVEWSFPSTHQLLRFSLLLVDRTVSRRDHEMCAYMKKNILLTVWMFQAREKVKFVQLFLLPHLVATGHQLPVVLIQYFCMFVSSEENTPSSEERCVIYFLSGKFNQKDTNSGASEFESIQFDYSSQGVKFSLREGKERERETHRINKSHCLRYHLSSFVEVT